MLAELGPNTIHRSWIYVDSYWNPDANTYDFNHPVPEGTPTMTLYQYLDGASASGDVLLVDLRGPAIVKRVLAGEISHDQLREALKRGLLHYRQRYPKIRYIELFSEMRANAKANDDQYYEIYRHAYRAVNEVNAELGLKPDQELLLGGPAPCSFSHEVKAFIERFAKDSNAAKRLDFIAYHDYNTKGFTNSLARREADVDAMLAANGLSTRMPIFVTEMGCFPVRHAVGTLAQDSVAQASCMATLFYYYNQQPDTQAFHWVAQHKWSDRKTQMLDNLSWTPYGCSLKMQKLLRRDHVHSNIVGEGFRGIFSVASRDETGVAVQLWNLQYPKGELSKVNLRIEHLPDVLADRSVRVRIYLIDATHSNCFHDPKQNDLQAVEDRTVSCKRTFETTVQLEPNALAFVELTPAKAD
jgi:hypothetical protein